MPTGPGKYDDACTVARESTGAIACFLIVLGGKHGSGFSMQAMSPEAHAGSVKSLPTLLRTVADDIEAEMKKPDTEVPG